VIENNVLEQLPESTSVSEQF